jgi:hypothetical protein
VCRLTAFVVKSFAQAKVYIPDTVQDETLQQAIAFLFNTQNRTGQFEERGKVIHEDMKVSTQ